MGGVYGCLKDAPTAAMPATAATRGDGPSRSATSSCDNAAVSDNGGGPSEREVDGAAIAAFRSLEQKQLKRPMLFIRQIRPSLQ